MYVLQIHRREADDDNKHEKIYDKSDGQILPNLAIEVSLIEILCINENCILVFFNIYSLMGRNYLCGVIKHQIKTVSRLKF